MTGTVYDPAGKVPLYNVIVYIPNADVEPFKKGATCDQCGAMASGSPIVTAVTDAAGKFTLKNGSYDWEFMPVDGQSFRDFGSAACVTPATAAVH